MNGLECKFYMAADKENLTHGRDAASSGATHVVGCSIAYVPARYTVGDGGCSATCRARRPCH